MRQKTSLTEFTEKNGHLSKFVFSNSFLVVSLRPACCSLFFVLCVLCILCERQTVFANELRTLTLDQALAIAMDKNRDIAKAREYGRYVQGRYVEERAAALPQLSLNGSAVMARDDSQSAMTGMTPHQDTRAVDLTLSQPLFTWGKIGAAIRAAQVGLKTADEQLRLSRQAAYRDVSTAFYDILLAKELHTLAEENLAQKQRLQNEARRKYEAGVATDYDVLAADVAVENARPEVIHSDNTIRTARERLRFLLALGVQEIDAAGSLASALEPPRSYDEALAVATAKRPELADARLRIGIYSELLTIASAENKPRLDLKGGAGWHWLDVSGAGAGQHLRADGAAWNVGAYLTFPFFDGMRTSGKVVQASSDLRTKEIETAKLLDSIALEVRITSDAVRESTEIVQALTGTVKQAERLLQMAEKGYEYGVKIRLEVDDAQLNLLQARGNLARAQRNYQAAQVEYNWAMGVAGE